ncbi:hypothetical protein [Leptolyngbya sp. FACHB-261]|uniref:hypothetical protein n=1 Tax=Leptolyngbya sp. FACHB-261 TaxID=2692806 RepID=UPI00168844A4|nr:hypothetical protein [Leptolyngbya sp. FACHB-261]MBD2101766.1 hypothetical protein [Leptolyngbya sp. FACHB-261]
MCDVRIAVNGYLPRAFREDSEGLSKQVRADIYYLDSDFDVALSCRWGQGLFHCSILPEKPALSLRQSVPGLPLPYQFVFYVETTEVSGKYDMSIYREGMTSGGIGAFDLRYEIEPNRVTFVTQSDLTPNEETERQAISY